MKKIAIILLSTVFSFSVIAEGKLNNWEEVKDKSLSDLLYGEDGKIVSVQNFYHSGHYILYHIMSNNILFKCTDELEDTPVDDGKAETSNCYKLKGK
jgi:hypothetical protein